MLVIIQNDPEVPLGAFAGYLADTGVPFTTVHPYRGEALPPAGACRAVIVLGGAMGAHDTERHPFLEEVKNFIRECVKLCVPFLGVCLGGQLLADVLGGRVSANACGEKGSLTVRLSPAGKADPLFAGIPAELVTFQWHNDCFAPPAGGELLASSDTCPGQAFRFGTNAYGLQFHPEVDRAIVDCWARWGVETASVADNYLVEFAAREEAYRNSSRLLLDNFIAISGLG